MKKIIVFVLFLALCGCCFAKDAFWHPNERPQVSLSQALSLAQRSLGSKQKDFFCVGVRLSKIRSEEDWQFTFGSKKSGMRYVMVSLDKKVRVSLGPIAT